MIDEYINYQLEAEKKYGKDTIVFYENGSFYEIYGVDNEKERVGQPKRVIELAHHQETAVGTDLRATELQSHARVEIHPITPLRTRTHWVIHETHPPQPSTP